MNLTFVLLLLFSCQPAARKHPIPETLGKIEAPASFKITEESRSSFYAYLAGLRFKKQNTVLLYDGNEKQNQGAHYAVIDMEIGSRDLQQCADAVMRLRSEWLYNNKRYREISFHFVNGQEFPYVKYAQGYRPVFKNNKFNWIKQAEENYSYPVFRKYLDVLFSYAGTASLIKDVKKANISDIRVGDIFLQSRNPYGHAVTVVAVAADQSGKRKFLLAQSYMPAQETHILNNFNSKTGEPWYDAENGEVETPEWTFHSDDLYRFP